MRIGFLRGDKLSPWRRSKGKNNFCIFRKKLHAYILKVLCGRIDFRSECELTLSQKRLWEGQVLSQSGDLMLVDTVGSLAS